MLKLNNHSWKKNTKLIFCGKSEAKISLFEKKKKNSIDKKSGKFRTQLSHKSSRKISAR